MNKLLLIHIMKCNIKGYNYYQAKLIFQLNDNRHME